MMLQRRVALNPPVPWSDEDEHLMLKYLRNETLNSEKLKALFPNRTSAGIRSKVRKLRIKHDLFGSIYRDKKSIFTSQIAQKICPKTVFDAYAGAGHQTFRWIEYASTVFASEKMSSKLSQFEASAVKNGFAPEVTTESCWRLYRKGEKRIYFYVGDAVDAAADIKVNKIDIDVLDLDTCGSTLPLLPTMLVLLKPKHLLITHGEFHSMRFKREDVLRRLFMHRDISENPFPISVDDMADELDKAVKISGLRSHNETSDSMWLNLESETWLGSKAHGMLRRHYSTQKPTATSDCINILSKPKSVKTSKIVTP